MRGAERVSVCAFLGDGDPHGYLLHDDLGGATVYVGEASHTLGGLSLVGSAGALLTLADALHVAADRLAERRFERAAEAGL